MAHPLTWNAPGLTWNQPGATWDGVVADRPKKMSKTKAVIDFTGYTAGDLAPVAQNIHDEMLAHVATFATPAVTMIALQTLVDDFNDKLAAKASRATADIVAFNVARHELEETLFELGNYVNNIAKGDPAIVVQSGFPSYQTGQVGTPGAPAAPTNLRLRHGDVSGEIVARYRPSRVPSMNEVQKCFGDPLVEANWVHAGTFSSGKAIISGVTPGAIVWIRVRTFGTKGLVGDWSDPAQIRGL